MPPMATHVIVGIVAFICGVVCAITTTVVVFEMIARVNEQLPEERQFSPLWWYPSKYSRSPNTGDFIRAELTSAGSGF
jgi:hypothetical protein